MDGHDGRLAVATVDNTAFGTASAVAVGANLYLLVEASKSVTFLLPFSMVV